MLDNYVMLSNGVIKQLNAEPIKYDESYINERYNTYGELGMQMAYLRLGYMLGVLKFTPESVLDVGYGNGDFLKACSNIIPFCYGNDISNYPIPDKCKFVENITKYYYKVITFFDVLEHFNDITFVSELKCDYVVISVPNCHYFSDEWFKEWKHRRYNEHIYHFNTASLINFMRECGFEYVTSSNIEDTIRKSNQSYSNILTAIFKKKN